MSRLIKRYLNVLLTIWFVGAISACTSLKELCCYPESVKYEWGWATQQINGSVQGIDKNPLPDQSFILVRTYYSQFVQFGEEAPLYFPQASLVFPDPQGNFSVPMNFGAAKIDLTFIASGYLMQNFAFQRQVGVGNLTYRARMEKTLGWQDHLFVSVMPFLQEFIIEQRYQLARAHQLFLGDWLEAEKAKSRTSISVRSPSN